MVTLKRSANVSVRYAGEHKMASTSIHVVAEVGDCAIDVDYGTGDIQDYYRLDAPLGEQPGALRRAVLQLVAERDQVERNWRSEGNPTPFRRWLRDWLEN